MWPPATDGSQMPWEGLSMLEQLEGSQALARTVAGCRPQVIPAYPISPQTHIVEGLSRLIDSGELTGCEFMNVESEYGAMSVAIGASAAGARTYTATASQGLLYMAEALYNASGLGLPIVMTLANRAIGAPINIWNDHSDSMSQRESGWIQMYVESNQEAVDTHILAFRLAEELSLPVMVCVDGFVLTHAYERIDVPTADQIDGFLGPFEPRQVLDPDAPVSIGAMVGPEAFMEVKYLAHVKQLQALDRIPVLATQLGEALGRVQTALVREYRSSDAETIIVALGSVLGTIEDAVDDLRERGVAVGAVGVKTFRPLPIPELAAALAHAKRIVVLEKALAIGVGGILAQDVRIALAGSRAHVHTVIAGLGGRPITRSSLCELLLDADQERLNALSFLDLDHGLVERELERTRTQRRSGPHAENMLRDVGVIAAGPV